MTDGAGPVRRVFPTMGTVVSVLVVDPDADADAGAALDDVVALFGGLDTEFSRWDAASPASAIAHGRMRLADASEDHREVYARAIDWRNRTGGAFDPHRPDGSVDLAGIVKAVAIERSGERLDRLACAGWCVNAGGDVLVRGRPAPDRLWRAGIADPADRTRLLTSIELDDVRRALATSGGAERGAHIWGPRSEALRQASVLAADIVTADVLATAVVAAGTPDVLRSATTSATAAACVSLVEADALVGTDASVAADALPDVGRPA